MRSGAAGSPEEKADREKKGGNGFRNMMERVGLTEEDMDNISI